MKAYTYPLPPAGNFDHVTKPSVKFRKQLTVVVASLVFFLFIYILLLVLAVLFAIACTVLGFNVLSVHPGIWTGLLGVAIAGLGWMVFYFLVKFMFAVKRERENKIEVTEDQHPALFDFIRNIAAETNTRFPAHIYITPDVNASVSYNSSFWSMFFPVRKNLTIGLGLVNMLELSEFKAVVAHEFGHFSQKSMKAGTFVYQSNKVIHNILFENDSYSNILDKWASVNNFFAVAARVTIVIVTTIQALLQQVYKIVNRSYMALSREMEFNADAMAAKVSGSNNAISALRRTEIAAVCYDAVLEQYDEMLKEANIGKNVYTQQRIVTKYLARNHGFTLSNGLPVLDELDKYEVTYRKVSISDQWASHPTRQQREEFLNTLNIQGHKVNDSAWILFNDVADLQLQLTGYLYRNVKYDRQPQEMDDILFESRYVQAIETYAFPSEYNGYYNNRRVSKINIDSNDKGRLIENVNDFFLGKADLQKKLNAVNEDLSALEYISQGRSSIKTFDYDGGKYRYYEAQDVVNELTETQAALTRQLTEADMTVYRHYLFIAQQNNSGEELQNCYTTFFRLMELTEENRSLYNTAMQVLQPVFSRKKIRINEAKQINEELIEVRDNLIARVRLFNEEIKALPYFGHLIFPSDIIAKVNKKQLYFVNDHFHNENLDTLIKALNTFAEHSGLSEFKAQKLLLEKQVEHVAV